MPPDGKESFLAFFPVVASMTNLSTSISRAKVKINYEIRRIKTASFFIGAKKKMQIGLSI